MRQVLTQLQLVFDVTAAAQTLECGMQCLGLRAEDFSAPNSDVQWRQCG